MTDTTSTQCQRRASETYVFRFKPGELWARPITLNIPRMLERRRISESNERRRSGAHKQHEQ